MTTPNVQTPTTEDAFDAASNPVLPTYDLFGKIEISAWACALVKGQGKVAFDPNLHEKKFTAIDVFVQPLPEINVKYPKSLEIHPIAESREWAQITLASIKALGIDNVREVNGRFARVTRVPSGKQYAKKDAQGNATGEMADETTFKFVEFYADENACRAAYLAAGGQPGNGNGNGHNVPATNEEAERKTAYQFLKVIVANAARGKELGEATKAVEMALAQYPTVAKFYTVESAETTKLILECAQA